MEFHFPAILGVQSGHPFYTAVVPFRMLGRIFEFDTGSVLERSQRNTDPGRAKALVRYMVHNHVMNNSFFLPPLVAVIESGDIRLDETEKHSCIGKLSISMDAKIKLLDGQHRVTAIIQALKECPFLCQSNISIQFYTNLSLKQRQQAFSDINSNSKPVSKSLNLAYNHRDELLAKLNKQIEKVDAWQGKIDRERNQANHKLNHLFSYKHAIAASMLLIGAKKGDSPSETDLNYVTSWWNAISSAVGWDKEEVDQNSVANTVVGLMALARVGARVKELIRYGGEVDQFKAAQQMFEISWNKHSTYWRGVLVREDEKMIVGKNAEIEAANFIIDKIEKAYGLK